MKKYKKIPYSDELIENCLRLIKQNPRITTNEIAEKLNKSPLTISRLFSFLRKEGLLPSFKKVMPHTLTLKEYPEEKEEEEDLKDELIEKLKEEIERLKNFNYNLIVKNRMLENRIKILIDTKREKIENEIKTLKNKMEQLENEINKMQWNFSDDLKERIHNTLLRIQKRREYWNLYDTIKKLENELSHLS